MADPLPGASNHNAANLPKHTTTPTTSPLRPPARMSSPISAPNHAVFSFFNLDTEGHFCGLDEARRIFARRDVCASRATIRHRIRHLATSVSICLRLAPGGHAAAFGRRHAVVIVHSAVVVQRPVGIPVHGAVSTDCRLALHRRVSTLCLRRRAGTGAGLSISQAQGAGNGHGGHGRNE